MNAEVFAEWLRRQGYHVIRTESSYWYNAGRNAYQAFPYHWQVEPSDTELNELVKKTGAVVLRYSKPITSQKGRISYHVIARLPYGIDLFKSHGRNGIKKGLSNCVIEQISFSKLADEGWNLQKDTLSRQQRQKSMSQAQWRNLCVAAENLPGFEAWAALAGGELAATVITVRIDDVWTIPYAQSRTEFLPLHANNALFFSVCKDFLERPGIVKVFTNLQSLDAPASVDEFKFRMGFVPDYIKQQIFFNPIIRPFIGKNSYRIVNKFHEIMPDRPFWAKAEGTLRFFIEGNQKPEEQKLPEIISPDCEFLITKMMNKQWMK